MTKIGTISRYVPKTWFLASNGVIWPCGAYYSSTGAKNVVFRVFSTYSQKIRSWGQNHDVWHLNKFFHAFTYLPYIGTFGCTIILYHVNIFAFLALLLGKSAKIGKMR